MKTGKNLIISFVLILAFSLYFFILSYQSKRQSEDLNRWVIHTHVVIEEITYLNTLITELETQDQEIVITNNIGLIKSATASNPNVLNHYNILKKLTADNPVQQEKLQFLLKNINEKIKYRNSVFDGLKKSQKSALALISNDEGEKLYAQIKATLSSMLKVEDGLLKERSAKYQAVSVLRFRYIVVFVVAWLILLAIALLRIYRESINRMKAEVEAQKSENKYRGLIEKSSLIIFTTDLRGRFTYISDKGLELTGYKIEELIGKPFHILIPQDQKDEISNFYLNQYKDFKKDLEEEFEIRSKDNLRKIIQLSTVLIEENGRITGFQSIAKDITEVKNVESLIKESKLQLQQQQEEYNLRMQSVLNNIPMILYIEDLEGRYVTVNKHFTETFGISYEAIIGKENIEIEKFTPRAEFFAHIDARVKSTGKPIEFEEVMSTVNGKRHFLVTKFPLFDKDNNIFAISSVAKDITEMREHMQQLINARAKAEKAEQLQETFLANMSHEIRTPMNGIMGMTNMLLDTSLDNEQKEYAELIKRSSDALLILINDILDLSKIKAGRMELEAIDFNVKEAVQNVLQPMKMSLKKNVVLNYEIKNSVPEFVKGDSHKLFQILNNLISNAAKFTEKGEIKVVVAVAKRNDEKVHIKIDVSDTGIGISSEHLKNIFESFIQAGNDTMRRFGGTGLGLSITKRLIELQDGNIQVESTLGSGTVFHVEIPYQLADRTETNAPVKINSGFKPYQDGIEDKRILVVEDNVVNQRVLTSVLKKMKVQWDIANNGKEAIEKLENGNTYHLIIMDLQMPVMDGFEATEHIRQQLKVNTPIIAMTASTLRNEKLKCFDIGMNEYLPKPYTPAVLIECIHNLINLGNINKEIV